MSDAAGLAHRRRLSGLSRVWILSAIVGVAAGVLAAAVWNLPAVDPPIEIPVFVFAILFYLAEVTVVHVRFRRDAHSFSMSEVPLVLSLYFLAPSEIIIAHLVGSAVALAFNRRQRSVKLAFNLGQLSLQTSVVIGIFGVLTQGADPLGPIGWLAVSAGITATVVISNTMIAAAIKMSGGNLSASDRNTMYLLSAGAGGLNAALALVTATVLWARPDNGWIALVPSAVLFFAYRAYLAQRLEGDRLQALYELSGELHRLPRIDDAVAAAADRARSMFDAESGEVLLFPEGADGPGLRTASVSDGTVAVMEPTETLSDDLSDWAAAGQTAQLITSPGSSRGVRMIVPIPNTEPGFGALLVNRPMSDIVSFGAKDLQMLETLADHVGVSLKNGRLEDSLAQLTELKDELHQQALHDGLTGLANRVFLQEELNRVLDAASGNAAVMFIDLDDFKSINDIHGHETGDLVLVEVAKRLRSSCRPNDIVARLGGDEFALLLERIASPADAVLVAERIIRLVGDPIETEGGAVETQASVGIAIVDYSEGPDDVMRRADEAMYAAKFDGKGCYRVHGPGMSSQHATELATVTGLREAIAFSQLELYFQPMLDLTTDSIVAVEALVRWNHPTQGLLGPGEFVPIAERRGMISELGEWVINTSIETLASWSERLDVAPPVMSINLSAAELANPELLSLIVRRLEHHCLDPSLLQIEIIESVMMTSDASILAELRERGARVALDDFGTGYSSLAYLDRLPVDVIKFDQSFLDRIGHPRVAKLVELMVDFGAAMGYATVAEGIETAEQLAAVQRLGCEVGQGYYLGRPAPEAAAFDLLVGGVGHDRLVAGVMPVRSAG